LEKAVYGIGDKVKSKTSETRLEFCDLVGKVIDFVFIGGKQFLRIQHNHTYTDVGSWRMEKI
jgi:hypothetical protein